MADGLPLHLHEQGGEGDGDVGEHEQGEAERVHHLLPRRRVDLSPLRNGGDGPDDQQRQVDAAQTLQQGAHGKPQSRALGKADARQRHVGKDADARQHEGGHDGHGHVEAAPAALGRALEELAAVPLEHLHIALGPAQPLAAGLAEAGGLLVVEHRVLADGNDLAIGDVVDGELDILRQQVEPPAAGLIQNTLGEQEPRSAHGGAGAQPHPRAVEIAALPQEPQAVTGADPVVGVVLAVAVAGDDLVSVGEHGVHLLNVVRGQDIVSVEYEVAVEAAGVVGLDVLGQKIQRIALAHIDVVEPLVHHRAVPPCDGGGVVGTVVRRYKDGEQSGVIRLLPEAVQQPADDGGLVPRRDEHGVAVGGRRAGEGAPLFSQHQRDI